jgi:hypothetical protein
MWLYPRFGQRLIETIDTLAQRAGISSSQRQMRDMDRSDRALENGRATFSKPANTTSSVDS